MYVSTEADRPEEGFYPNILGSAETITSKWKYHTDLTVLYGFRGLCEHSTEANRSYNTGNNSLELLPCKIPQRLIHLGESLWVSRKLL